MSFVSFSFVLLFALALVCRVWLGPTKVEKAYLTSLLVLSLVFYASFYPPYLLLLLFTTLVDYYAGKKIYAAVSPARKKIFLVFSLAANLGLLAFFKYTDFVLETWRNICGFFHMAGPQIPYLNLLLPIGISFFTFQSMSYTIDLYRGRIQPAPSYGRFLLFVCFFTHLISGPIVRASELMYQFNRKRKMRMGVVLQGLYLMVFGYFLKMVVADNLAGYINRYWSRGASDNMPAVVPLSLAVLFSCQIFADIYGYTNIARGTAYLLGFRLPVNFNSPYIAGSFREFWTRWHISLSRWIRDYLYIPLGGNRGASWRPFLTLFITFLLAGLWHGAAFTFLIWGGLHGIFLGVERLLGFNREGSIRNPWMKLIWFLTSQFGVLTAWIFFRARTVVEGFHFLGNLGHFWWGWRDISQIATAFLFVIPVFLIHVRTFLVEGNYLSAPGFKEKGIWVAVMLYCLLTLYGKNNAFIYFQF